MCLSSCKRQDCVFAESTVICSAVSGVPKSAVVMCTHNEIMLDIFGGARMFKGDTVNYLGWHLSHCLAIADWMGYFDEL